MREGIWIWERLTYWLSEQPAIVRFRWSNNGQQWGSTWPFLFASNAIYILLALFLHILLLLFGRRRPISIGPLASIHSLIVAVVSAVIFAGMLLSAAAEIHETRWFWQRSKTPLQWLLCFPLGVRPTGRVFFWSYVFYLAQFLLLFRTFFGILHRHRLTSARLLRQPILILMSFLWLEYSQSFQVIAILATSLAHMVIFGYRFSISVRPLKSNFPIIRSCQLFLLGCNMVSHVGVLVLHYTKGGCNGVVAWVINSLLNGVLLVWFLKQMHRDRVRNMCLENSTTASDADIGKMTGKEIVKKFNKDL